LKWFCLGICALVLLLETLGRAWCLDSLFQHEQIVDRGTYGTFTTPVAAIRLTMNALSSAGGRVTATILQAGIGWTK
jgi:hypothetical protein